MRIAFFCKVDRKALDIIEFYKQDIEILRELGHELIIATKYREIDWSADMIFVWWWTYAFYPVFKAKLLRKKIIITGTFNFRAPDAPMDFFRRSWWQKVLIKYSIKNATKNILVSKAEFDSIKNEWKLSNIYYSPHVIDIEKYTYSERQNNKFFFTIIWTGSINLQRKFLPEIIEAAKIFNKKYPDYLFLIAGRKGDGYDYANDLINKAGLKGFVKLLGEITEKEKIKYLQTCTVYLQPSKYEGFGVAIAEAMACGAPVISSKAGEVENVVSDTGILLASCEPIMIEEKLDYLINNTIRRKILGKKARSRIEKFFNKDRRKNDFKLLIEE